MSLRQFYPKRNSRRAVSTKKLFALYAVTLIAILLQVSYPLINGETLRVVTIATVYWAAGAMLLHAWIAYGFTYAITFFWIIYIVYCILSANNL